MRSLYSKHVVKVRVAVEAAWPKVGAAHSRTARRTRPLRSGALDSLRPNSAVFGVRRKLMKTNANPGGIPTTTDYTPRRHFRFISPPCWELERLGLARPIQFYAFTSVVYTLPKYVYNNYKHIMHVHFGARIGSSCISLYHTSGYQTTERQRKRGGAYLFSVTKRGHILHFVMNIHSPTDLLNEDQWEPFPDLRHEYS